MARDFRNQGAPVDALLLESYGRLCDLLLCPAPDLRALAAKIEAGEADIFRHEPSLARLAAALVQDARRLIPAG